MGLLRDAADLYRRILPIEMLSLPPGMVAGAVLASHEMEVAMQAYPGLLMMVPAIMATRGNVFGAMGARITTGLHQGLLDPDRRWQPLIRTLLVTAAVNSVAAAVFISSIAWVTLLVVGGTPAPFLFLLAISLVSAVLSLVAMSGVVLLLLFWGYRNGYDPELLNPAILSAGDIFGVTFIYVAVTLVGVFL